MNISNFKELRRAIDNIRENGENIPWVESGCDDEELHDTEYLLDTILDDVKDVQGFLTRIQERRRSARRKAAERTRKPKISKHPNLLDKRFRKARTYSNWCECDGLRYKQGDGTFNMNWHFFRDGDVVEFKSPKTGKLSQSAVTLGSHEQQLGNERIRVDRAYVKVDRKTTRVVEAPTMRLISRKRQGA